MSPRFLIALGWLLVGFLVAVRAEDRPANALVTKTYAVADLVVPFEPGTKSAPSKTLEGNLINLMVETVQPHSWEKRGGAGSVEYFPLTMCFVVRQKPEVHEQLAELLQALRRLMDREVVAEVRIVSIPETFFERVGVDFDFTKPLNKDQVAQFMKALQSDPKTNVMQAPKIAVFDGQKANVDVVDQQTFVTGLDVRTVDGQLVGVPHNEAVSLGTRLSVRPVICPENRSVEMKVEAELMQLDGPPALVLVKRSIMPTDGPEAKPVLFTQYVQQPKVSTLKVDKTVTLPSGGTVVINVGKRITETRNEYGPPMLSKIPYLNRLFKNVGVSHEMEHVLMLVTAHIHTTPEEEQKKPVAVAPCPKTASADERTEYGPGPGGVFQPCPKPVPAKQQGPLSQAAMPPLPVTPATTAERPQVAAAIQVFSARKGSPTLLALEMLAAGQATSDKVVPGVRRIQFLNEAQAAMLVQLLKGDHRVEVLSRLPWQL